MKTILMMTAATLAAQVAAQQAPQRNPNPPLPPTVSFPTTSPTPPLTPRQAPTENPAPAEAATPVAQPRQRGGAQNGMKSRPLAAVAFDRAQTGELWALGTDWKASFDQGGFTFVPFFGSDAPRNFPVRIALASATVGGEALPLGAAEPTREGDVVRTDRGGLVETVATGLRSVEQSFVFATLPNRGDVHVDIAMHSELVAAAMADGVEFANEHGAVAYRKAVAVDAAGATLPLAIEWDGDSAHITIPAAFVAKAQLPLVLDPIVNTRNSLSAATTQLVREPDVATLPTPERSLVVWQRQWSFTDWDCYAELIDGNLGSTTGSALSLDFTGVNWLYPRVAGSPATRNFLVVAQLDNQGTAKWVGGRTVNDTGVVGPVFDIERAGVVGIAGNSLRPVVGSDNLSPAYYCVAFEKEVGPGNRDIYYKMVQPNGTLLTTNPSVLANLPEDESAPAISKSTGGTFWMVAWQRQWPATPFDQDIWTALISYGGLIHQPGALKAGSIADELRPACSSPLSRDVVLPEARMLAYELVQGAQADIQLTVVDSNNISVAAYNLSVNESFGAFQSRNQGFAEVDSNGVRFAVGYAEYSGTDYDTYVSTVAFDSTTNQFRIDETRVLLGGTVGTDDYSPRMSAYRDGLSQDSRYLITSARIGANDISVFDYGSYAAGPLFSYYASACGTSGLTMTPSGVPALGQSVSFVVNTPLPAGIAFGLPGNAFLGLGCFCSLGLDINSVILTGNPLTVPIPNNLALVGQTFSAQGYGYVGTNCFGLFDLTDTIDFTIR